MALPLVRFLTSFFLRAYKPPKRGRFCSLSSHLLIEQVTCLKDTIEYDEYRARVSRLLKGGGSAEGLQEPEIDDVDQLLEDVKGEVDLDM